MNAIAAFFVGINTEREDIMDHITSKYRNSSYTGTPWWLLCMDPVLLAEMSRIWGNYVSKLVDEAQHRIHQISYCWIINHYYLICIIQADLLWDYRFSLLLHVNELFRWQVATKTKQSGKFQARQILPISFTNPSVLSNLIFMVTWKVWGYRLIKTPLVISKDMLCIQGHRALTESGMFICNVQF